MRIILVEDDQQLGSTLQRTLDGEGYLAEWVISAEQAELALRNSEFDLMVLDWMLPQLSGVELLRKLRLGNCTMPVLLLTARLGTEQKVIGLDAGADDYLTKPFDLDELLARIRALLRRRVVKADLVLRNHGLELNPDKNELVWQDQHHELSKNEMIIMRLLMENSDRYVSKSRIEDAISHWEQPITGNAIEAQISRLRKRLGKELIQTLRGVGYKINSK
jgi:DNA-binding response OmpR family regulator